MHFAIAEVAGYGPGVAGDRIYRDYGGGTGKTTTEPGPYFHPVPSWYDTMWYDYMNLTPGLKMGNTYLQQYSLPPYVNSNVISIRDVADRAIQMYKGGSLIKYDSIQYEPINSPYPGVYNAPEIQIPCPSPKITVVSTPLIKSQITWGPQVESITNATPGFSHLHAPLSYYQVIRSLSPIGPWTVLDSVGRSDGRYFSSGTYTFNDFTALLNIIYYYAVVSLDTLGAKSGLTNITQHTTQLPAVKKLDKVYAAPNPFIVSSYADNNDKIGIYGLPEHATIRVYSYSGQLIQTIQHDADESATAWVQISRNNQWIASGVYYFTVDDNRTGDKAWGKFIIIH
jgi:hypothetical protein